MSILSHTNNLQTIMLFVFAVFVHLTVCSYINLALFIASKFRPDIEYAISKL